MVLSDDCNISMAVAYSFLLHLRAPYCRLTVIPIRLRSCSLRGTIGVMSAKLACQRGTIYVEDTCYLGYIVFNILHTVASGNGILVFVMGGSSLTFLSSKFDILKFCKIMSFED